VRQFKALPGQGSLLWRFCEKGRKHFFFEKKKQKTSVRASRIRSLREPSSGVDARSNSFLVLFFKKELLPFLLLT
jgi:hypothetical protein